MPISAISFADVVRPKFLSLRGRISTSNLDYYQSMASKKERINNFIDTYYYVILTPVVFLLHKAFVFLTNPFAAIEVKHTAVQSVIQNFGLLLFSFIIVRGSIYISARLNRYLPWVKTPAWRALTQLVAQLALAVVWIGIYQTVIAYFLHDVNILTLVNSEAATPEIKFILWRVFFASILVSLFVSVIITGRAFRLKTDEMALHASELKRIAMQAELESLKLQLDPHFMFNNFSALSELIEEDKAQAQSFVEHLSRVYRYMVQNINHDVITLQKELKFIESYNYLINIRHGNNVIIDIKIPESKAQKKIPPITLQLLIENAMKHNIASEGQPLHISIFADDDYLVVTNKLQKIMTAPLSAKIGLENIKARYRIVSGLEPIIEQTDSSFFVRLPLLN